MMKIQPISDTFGAEVTDVNLADLKADQFRQIEIAWNTYSVLVFPKQGLNDEEHLQFTRRFGRLERGLKKQGKPRPGAISNVDKSGNIVPNSNIQARFNIGNSVWHTDSSYKRVGAKASLLAAHVVPDQGGETEWADMRAGYDALEVQLKDWLSDKIAIHNFRWSHAWHGGLEILNKEELRELPPVEHSIIRKHPDSGRMILFIGRHASHIVGEPLETSRKLLRELTDNAARAPRTWKYSWQPGDIAIWDNRCVLHRGHSFPADQARVMVRTTVAGDAPDNEWAA